MHIFVGRTNLPFWVCRKLLVPMRDQPLLTNAGIANLQRPRACTAFMRHFASPMVGRCSHRTFDSDGEALNVFSSSDADPVKRMHVPIN